MRYTDPNRRTFLKAAGTSIALPLLESMPHWARGADGGVSGAGNVPRRMVCVGNEFGMYPEAFWPQGTGRDYELSPSLEPLRQHRQDFSLFRISTMT